MIRSRRPAKFLRHNEANTARSKTMGQDITDNEEIPAEEYRRAKRKAKYYIRYHYPAYKDKIVSIGGCPRGKFLMVYIALSPYDNHKVYVPTVKRRGT
jgi:hypothetical protein